MIHAGILPGDLVIVERGRTAKNKDIVIAQVDGEWTMRHYEERSSILSKQDLVVSGVVTAVIRKYK